MNAILTHWHLILCDMIGTKEVIDGRRRRDTIKYGIDSLTEQDVNTILCGSKGEGFDFTFSDYDVMLVPKKYVIIDHNDDPPFNSDVTLRMIYDQHHRGSVLLQVVSSVNEVLDECVNYRGRVILASSMMMLDSSSDGYINNGPCNTKTGSGVVSSVDLCLSIKCHKWPDIALEFIQRRRKYGWPPPDVIKAIVNDGCYCVPVGDGTSPHSWLQWRLSFATAEKRLVHSFSYLDLKVYALLKICHNDIFKKIKDQTDGESLMCSYFLKTVIFLMKENSPASMWTDVNILNCFWMCFNFLIESIEKGYLCHYFLPGNNLFHKRIHGRNRQLLLHLLYRLKRKGINFLYECPSVKQMFDKLYSRSCLCMNSTEREFQYDHGVFSKFAIGIPEYSYTNCLSYCFHFLRLYDYSHNDTDLFTLFNTLRRLLLIYSSQLLKATRENVVGNKIMYYRRRMCRHYLLFSSHVDVSAGWLALATYHYNMGQHRVSLTICRHVFESIKPYSRIDGKFIDVDAYRNMFCGKGISVLTKMKEAFSDTYYIYSDMCIYLEELNPEVMNPEKWAFRIQPQPYAMFLTFLCCDQMDDADGRHTALSTLLALQYDDIQGINNQVNPYNYILYHLIGICYEIIGDYHNAEINYLSSAEQDHDLTLVAKQRAENVRTILERN